MKTNLIIVGALVLGGACSFAAYQFSEMQASSPGDQEPARPKEAVRTFTDDTGHTLRLRVPVQRIVTCYAAFAQMIESLGREDALVGATREQAESRGITNVGTHMSPDFEAIVSCRPDLVIVSSHRKKAVSSLREMLGGTDSAVLAVHPETVNDTLDLVRKLGAITGKEKRSRRLVRKARERLEKVKSQVEAVPKRQRKEVFFEVRAAPSLLTCGTDSVAYNVMQLAGGRPVFRKAGSVVQIDVERVVHAQPDAYIQQVGVMNPDPVHPSEHAVVGELDCVREGRFVRIEEEQISRPGLQLISAVEKVYEFLYGDDEQRSSMTGRKSLNVGEE